MLVISVTVALLHLLQFTPYVVAVKVLSLARVCEIVSFPSSFFSFAFLSFYFSGCPSRGIFSVLCMVSSKLQIFSVSGRLYSLYFSSHLASALDKKTVRYSDALFFTPYKFICFLLRFIHRALNFLW